MKRVRIFPALQSLMQEPEYGPLANGVLVHLSARELLGKTCLACKGMNAACWSSLRNRKMGTSVLKGWRRPPVEGVLLKLVKINFFSLDGSSPWKILLWCVKMDYHLVSEYIINSLGIDPSREKNKLIVMASMAGSVKTTSLLLGDPRVDPSDRNSLALTIAVKRGNAGVVQMLLKDGRSDPRRGNEAIMRSLYKTSASILTRQARAMQCEEINYRTYAYVCERDPNDVWKSYIYFYRIDGQEKNSYPRDVIVAAAAFGRCSVVPALLNDRRSDPSCGDSMAIRVASANGHAGVVRLLLRDGRSDPSARRSEALRIASANGHSDVVKLLLDDGRSDPSANGNESIWTAAVGGHMKVIRLLLREGAADGMSSTDLAAIEQAHAEALAEAQNVSRDCICDGKAPRKKRKK